MSFPSSLGWVVPNCQVIIPRLYAQPLELETWQQLLAGG